MCMEFCRGSCDLLRFHSGTAMLGVFAASSRALCAKAPHPSLRPATIAPAISPVVVIGFEFVTDIGPVNELCIAVPLRDRHLPLPLVPLAAGVLRGRMPTWIWHLPVSTEIANVLGRQMWGFPKIHADIRIDEDGLGNRSTRLSENGTPILSLHGPAYGGAQGRVGIELTNPFVTSCLYMSSCDTGKGGSWMACRF
jgi:hypothetical protein